MLPAPFLSGPTRTPFWSIESGAEFFRGESLRVWSVSGAITRPAEQESSSGAVVWGQDCDLRGVLRAMSTATQRSLIVRVSKCTMRLATLSLVQILVFVPKGSR